MKLFKLDVGGAWGRNEDDWLIVEIQGYRTNKEGFPEAIVIALFDNKWQKLPIRDRLHINGVNNLGYVYGRLYSESLNRLKLIEEIPTDIDRDRKIGSILN